MGQTSNTFRIFVSSTFSDLHEERNALQKYVFPRLRELCLQNGCRFQAIDLRWGVSVEAGRDQQTMKICLEEIKRCQRVTPRPNFIVLLGDRYGWCPLPSEIPETEFEQIIKNVNDEDKAILLQDESKQDGQNSWYRKDDNAVPPIYCLQERNIEYEEYSDWEKVERRLRAILENAVDGVNFEDEKERAKYVASATEQEINQGLNSQKATEHVFCFFRQITNQDDLIADLPQQKQAKDFIELNENNSPNKVANNKLENLKKRLREQLPKQNVYEYKAQWLGNGADSKPKPLLTQNHIGSLPDDLEECLKLLDDENAPKNLCVDVWRQLALVMREEIANIESVTPVQREKEEHEKFGKERAKNFVGRASYLESISQYVNADDQHPFALWGGSGSGKSALMAYAAKQISETNPNDVLVVRFIGATPQSSDIRSLLESLCQEISAEETTIPTDYNELIKEFEKLLDAAKEKQKHLFIMLDALDQLSDAENAQNLRWLPDRLPENVRLIVSTLPDDSFKIIERKLPAENIIQLEPLSESEGGEVLNLWLTDAKRTLTENQRAEVLDKFTDAKGLPLYLKFAFEEARLWHSYGEIKPLSADVKGIIGDLFKRLSDEANHGAMMVKRALGYLAAARYGLTEDELIEVLWQDDEIKKDFHRRSPKSPEVDSLPVVVWSRLYFDLEPYLTERASANAALLSFYHRQLGEVTAQKYLDGADKQRAHKHLADYFDGQNYWLETPEQYRDRVGEFPKSARRSNHRKASEFAFQLRQSGNYERLEQIHTNLDFLESKTAAGLVFELAKDFIEAVKLIPSERPQRRIIRLLEEALRRDIHFIARHREDYPQSLFQCLWNSGWWYDCPQAANHYEEKDGPWSRDGEKLYQLLEKWREQKETETSDFPWLRALLPPSVHLGTTQIAVLKGHWGGVMSIAISTDGQRIVSGSADRTVRVWDINTSDELMELYGHTNWVVSVAISTNGKIIVSGSEDATVRVWDMETGAVLRVLKGNGGRLISVVISPDGQRIVSSSEDLIARVWDTETGTELLNLKGHKSWVISVAVSPDGRRIVSGSSDKTVRVWNMDTGDELMVLNGHEEQVRCVAISADGRRIVSASADKSVRLWDMDTGADLMELKGTDVYLNCVAISPDGRRIAVGGGDYVTDNAIHIWDLDTGEELKVLKGHAKPVECVAFSPDGQRIISCSEDKTIRIWEIKIGDELMVSKNTTPDDLQLIGVPESFPLRISAHAFETSIGDEKQNKTVSFSHRNKMAYLPDSLAGGNWTDGVTFMGFIGPHVCFIRLEGKFDKSTEL